MTGPETRNVREIRSVIDLASNSNVNGIIVGNETIYRGELKVDELIKIIQRVKREVNVPVTTGEIWNVWIRAPGTWFRRSTTSPRTSCPIGKAFPRDSAVDQAMHVYDELRKPIPASAS